MNAATATHPLPTALAEPVVLSILLAAIERLPAARVAVFGDLCVDAYWTLDEQREEQSVETGLPVAHVGSQRYSLGAAGNVAVNVAALGAAQVELIGVVGTDCFGHQLLELAGRQGIGTAGIVRGASWQTMVYAKPLSSAGERPRIDFGANNRLDAALISGLVDAIEAAAGRCGAVVLNQQVGQVLADAGLIEAVNAVIARHPTTLFLVDARIGAERYHGAALKLNVREAARLLGRGPLAEPVSIELATELASELHGVCGQPVFLTRGERGLLLVDAGVVTVIPGVSAAGRIDPVGAGDAVTATLAAALSVGIAAATAGQLANLAAAVTVRKLDTTGSASPAELRALAAAADHLHAPELAEDRRRARFLPGSEIEVVREHALTASRGIVHAIFDHDGTISTLRQGWEAMMEPMMARAVLGAQHATASTDIHRRVAAAVRELIERTTGIQTLAQMEELRGLVRDFGCVPEVEILDCHGYKKIYNDALLAQIHGRVARLASGELIPADFIIRGAVELLTHLRQRGVHLHLASGTDRADVIAEATALGYADLFDGGIHGAVGSLAVEAKREVMDRIMREHGIAGHALLVVGDGPVEIREGRRRGALCLAIASDEPRRYGLDPAKRARLIRAGADLLVGDFTQLNRLLPALGLA